jgi:pyruvate-formate lyase-activating enzyme
VETKFLDVGSGPFSRCGFITNKTKLDFQCVDPLAIEKLSDLITEKYFLPAKEFILNPTSIKKLCKLLIKKIITKIIGKQYYLLFRKCVLKTKENAIRFGHFSAIKHVFVYKKLRKKYPNMPTAGGIELSNVCNLKCPNCPTPTTKYPRGFADKKTVKLAFKYTPPGGYVSFHRLGEPLLHRDFLKYFIKASKIGFNICISTNGILLTEDLSRKIILKGKPSIFYISLHTKKSLEAFFIFLKLYKEYNCKFNFYGQILSHNRQEVLRWIDELHVSFDDIQNYIRDVPSHSWAGNVKERKHQYTEEETKEKIKQCRFIKNNIVNIRYDGTVVACCFDSENVTELGTVKNFTAIQHNPNGYELCDYCDPTWVHE